MNYKELNDNELVYLCNENNEDAINLVIDKYKSCIITILKEYFYCCLLYIFSIYSSISGILALSFSLLLFFKNS